MTRPRFETPADRARELATAQRLSLEWDCILVGEPQLAEVDFRAYRDGRVVAVVEIKSRLNREPSDFGGLLFLNGNKHQALVTAAHTYGARAAMFCWHFPREIRYIDVIGPAWQPWPVETRGRGDRDGQDVCPAYRIPLAATRRLDLMVPPPRPASEEHRAVAMACQRLLGEVIAVEAD